MVAELLSKLSELATGKKSDLVKTIEEDFQMEATAVKEDTKKKTT